MMRPHRRLPSRIAAAALLWFSLHASGADEVLQRGEALMRSFSWDEAYEYLLPFAAERAGQYQFDVMLGRSAFNAQRFSEAARVFERIVAAEPDQALGHFDLGRAYFMLGDLPAAKQQLERARALVPTPDTMIELVLAYIDDRLKK